MDANGGHYVKRNKPGSESQNHVFSHTWKLDPKINTYTKTSMIIYKLSYNMFITVELLYRTWGKRERKRK
jgi:hypothetical protein